MVWALQLVCVATPARCGDDAKCLTASVLRLPNTPRPALCIAAVTVGQNRVMVESGASGLVTGESGSGTSSRLTRAVSTETASLSQDRLVRSRDSAAVMRTSTRETQGYNYVGTEDWDIDILHQPGQHGARTAAGGGSCRGNGGCEGHPVRASMARQPTITLGGSTRSICQSTWRQCLPKHLAAVPA